MKLRTNMVFFGFLIILMSWSIPAAAFMGDYISEMGDDMAVIVNIKSSDIDYESDDDDSGGIDRKIISAGLSKSLSPLVKIFGFINYSFDGELPINIGSDRDGSADLESGYGLSVGGSYLFWDQEVFAAQAFGQMNYTFEETFKYSGINVDFAFDGYEFLAGVMGIYRLLPEFQIYTALELVPYSDFSMEIDGSISRDEWDLKRDQILGVKAGLLYDLETWFVKGEAEIGSEQALGFFGGIKF